MDIFGFDLTSLFSIDILVSITTGTLLGLVVGSLPGLGAVVALVLILPFTYVMDPLVAILMLLSAYQAAEYGGSISSIVLGIPGTAAAVATKEDGFPMAKQGLPGRALGISLTASTIGGIVGGLCLLLISKPVTEIALQFSSSEFFLLAVLGLIALTTVSTKSKLKTWISILAGLMASTIGIDLATGVPRFTGGSVQLSTGLPLVVVMIGLFAFSELFTMIETNPSIGSLRQAGSLNAWIRPKDIRTIAAPTAIGSLIGSFIGIIPGMGAGVASWFSYGIARNMSRHKNDFGRGRPEGIAAPEAANNAVVGTSMVPLLTLGVPGSATAAVIMGAFVIQGIEPGPTLFETNTQLVYGILFGFLLTTVATYVLGIALTPAFARALKVPMYLLAPIVILLSILGVYATSAAMLDVWLALGLGVIVYVLNRFDFAPSGFILAFILGGIIEENYRRTLQLSDGSFTVFITRPWSLGMVVLMAVLLAYTVFSAWRSRRRTKAGRLADSHHR